MYFRGLICLSIQQADLNVTGDEPFGVKDGSFTETSVFTKVDGVEPPIQDTGKTLQEEKSMHYYSLRA